ncbi:MAG: hypothetical protein V4508_02295 [Pseudomonadota bacterium]
MKISKLLKIILGMAGFFNMGIVEEGGGGAAPSTGPLDANSAADAFSRLGGDAPNESEQNDDTPEAAAERLAKQELSGNDDNPAPDDDADPATLVAADDVTIEVDGKPVKLTRAELIENYKSGLRQADYTQKTMQAAEARKTAEAETQQVRNERATLAQQLNTFAIQADGEIHQLRQALTQELWDNDPVRFLEIERTANQRQAQSQEAQGRLQHLNQQFQAEQAEAMKHNLEEQGRQLLAKLPEWADPAKAETESKAIKQYLGTLGFAPQEQSFNDHRHILLARKAMQFDALIERAGKAVKKVATLPTKVERSGSTETSKPDGRTESMKRLGRTGSIDDAAAAFGALRK